MKLMKHRLILALALAFGLSSCSDYDIYQPGGYSSSSGYGYGSDGYAASSYGHRGYGTYGTYAPGYHSTTHHVHRVPYPVYVPTVGRHHRRDRYDHNRSHTRRDRERYRDSRETNRRRDRDRDRTRDRQRLVRAEQDRRAERDRRSRNTQRAERDRSMQQRARQIAPILKQPSRPARIKHETPSPAPARKSVVPKSKTGLQGKI